MAITDDLLLFALGHIDHLCPTAPPVHVVRACFRCHLTGCMRQMERLRPRGQSPRRPPRRRPLESPAALRVAERSAASTAPRELACRLPEQGFRRAFDATATVRRSDQTGTLAGQTSHGDDPGAGLVTSDAPSSRPPASAGRRRNTRTHTRAENNAGDVPDAAFTLDAFPRKLQLGIKGNVSSTRSDAFPPRTLARRTDIVSASNRVPRRGLGRGEVEGHLGIRTSVGQLG